MINDRYEQTSVCEVTVDYDGQKWLTRLADIDAKTNSLIKFYFNEDLPWYFDNRNRLYLKSGPDGIGNIGIWHWTATQRDTDSTKDYIDAEYIPDISPIEVIEKRDMDSIESLIGMLKDGIRSTDTGIETIYCVKTGKNEYKGILCKDIYFRDFGAKKALKPELNSLPLIELKRSEIIQTEGHAFLRSLAAPISKKKIFLKSPMEVVKDIILRRCSWSTMKAAGLSKNEFKHLRDYIKEIPDNNLYKEIADSCGCSNEEAQSFVNQFVKDLTRYLSLDDIEFQIVDKAIDSHEALSEKYRAQIKQQWETQNASEIAKEKEKLNTVTRQLEERQKKLADINSEIESRETDRQKLYQQIDEDQHFADEVQADIEKKINEAKQNAAAFIAEMAFTQPVVSKEASTAIVSSYDCPSFEFIEGQSISNEGAEKISNLRDCAGILTDELQEAGVSEEYRAFLASFLMSAWSTHMPLLIAGPNAAAISDALSASLNCRMADRIKCVGNYSKLTIGDNKDTHSVTVIENVFSGDWIDHIQDLMLNNKCFYIFTNPFAEDLLIEPHGLYNYMLPFFTEPFIDDVPTSDFYGGILNEKYAIPQSGSNSSIKVYEQFLKEIGCGNYLISRISKITRAMSSYPGHKPDWDYYVLLAYSILVGAKDNLLEQLDHDGRVSGNCKRLINQLLGAYK